MSPSRCLLAIAGVVILATSYVGLATAEGDERGFREPDMQGPFRVDMDRVIDGWRFNLQWREGPRSRRDGRFHLSDVHTPNATATDQACEREVGIAVRDFVRRHVRGSRLRARDVRRGRDTRIWVGRLEVDGEDLSTLLLDLGMAVPYHDSPRNPALRSWDCADNESIRESLSRLGQ
jgi:endonuclease YncB( thermonuclease family)